MNLQERQKLDLITKILYTKIRVYQFVKKNPAYVGFSGGRDSSILSHIIRTNFFKEYREVFISLGEFIQEGSILDETFDIPHVFCNTGVEWPEIVRFVRAFSHKNKVNVIELHPKKTFFQIITQYGYPVISKEVASYIKEARETHSKKLFLKRIYGEKKGTYVSGKIPLKYISFLEDDSPKINDVCCDWLKKKPSHDFEKKTGLRPILAIMAEESRLRTQLAKNGCIYEKAEGSVCNPMIFWTHDDILLYEKLFKPELCELYSQGFDRTGCIGCLFGCQTSDQAEEKLKSFKTRRPKQYQIYLDNGLEKVLSFLKKNDNLSNEEKKEILAKQEANFEKRHTS